MATRNLPLIKALWVFIPPGLKHCPLLLKRVDRPIFHFSVVTAGYWDSETLNETHEPESDYSKYIVTELKTPEFKPGFDEDYKKFAKRVLWIDKNIVPGAFQMNVSWYCRPANHAPVSHRHDDDELIGFFGGDSDDRYSLNGEVEIWMGDEQFLLTKSTLLFCAGRHETLSSHYTSS